MCTTAAIGIDLGTTFSCVSVYHYEKPTVIKCQGQRTIPSSVFYHDEKQQVYVGQDAFDTSPRCPRNELYDSKRLLGRKYDDDYIQKMIKSQLSFVIAKGDNGEALYSVEYKQRKLKKAPEAVCSEILTILKNTATDYLGLEVTEAVISVPACFTNSQRKATLKAAEMAGLNVLRFISEPVAGAIHYTFDKDISGNIFVFDFGGGTIDTSIITVKHKQYKVKAVNGDSMLGGRDIDNNLVKYFRKAATMKHLNNDIKFQRRLLTNCIKLKKKLSSLRLKTEDVEQTFFYDKEYSLVLSRKTFDDINSQIYQRAMEVAKSCLFNAGIKKSDIEKVVLIGGSCRILRIQELLEAYFESKKILKDVDPDEAIAQGACIQAALLKGGNGDLEVLKIQEVTPLSLGIICFGDLSKPFIKRNTPLPASESSVLCTTDNDQESITFEVYEGERKRCKFNNRLGQFTIHGLPKGKAGNVEFLTKFYLDENGVLKVEASNTITGTTKDLVVSLGDFHLCETERFLEDAEKNAKDDEEYDFFMNKRNRAIKITRSLIFDSNSIQFLRDRFEIQNKCHEYISCLTSLNYYELKEMNKASKKLAGDVLPTIKTYRSKFQVKDIDQLSEWSYFDL